MIVKPFFIFAFCFVVGFLSESQAQITRSTTFDDRPACEEVKGVWRQFGNGCAGQCEPKFDEFIICTQAINYGCDCGKGRCWNGETCVSLESYKQIYEAKKAEEQKNLAEAQEKRKASAKENEQAIMAKLLKKDENGKPIAPSQASSASSTASSQPRPIVTREAQTADNDSIPPLSPEQAAALKNRIQARQENTTVPPLFLKREQIKQALANQQNQGDAKSAQGQTTSNQGNSDLPSLPVIPLPN